ncbi:unnamed protein product, partial [marine sediment metagenome]
HIPRNGGTSINNALYGRFMGHYTARDVRFWAPDLFGRLPSFAVTRNPWARLLSAYRFAEKQSGVLNKLGEKSTRPSHQPRNPPVTPELKSRLIQYVDDPRSEDHH